MLVGISVILKYIFSNKSKSNIELNSIEDVEDKVDNQEEDEYISEIFSNKSSIFLMIALFLIFILIIIYISRRFY